MEQLVVMLPQMVEVVGPAKRVGRELRVTVVILCVAFRDLREEVVAQAAKRGAAAAVLRRDGWWYFLIPEVLRERSFRMRELCWRTMRASVRLILI
jgi:hypothetical protein